jgi:hypothetical protein
MLSNVAFYTSLILCIAILLTNSQLYFPKFHQKRNLITFVKLNNSVLKLGGERSERV